MQVRVSPSFSRHQSEVSINQREQISLSSASQSCWRGSDNPLRVTSESHSASSSRSASQSSSQSRLSASAPANLYPGELRPSPACLGGAGQSLHWGAWSICIPKFWPVGIRSSKPMLLRRALVGRPQWLPQPICVLLSSESVCFGGACWPIGVRELRFSRFSRVPLPSIRPADLPFNCRGRSLALAAFATMTVNRSCCGWHY